MRTYLSIMGCAQTSASVLPTNNHIPIERLFTHDDSSPVVMITASPTPAYVKSALKKPPFDARGRTTRVPIFNRKRLSISKSVNFDEQVLVKARTPTPTKIWYDKPTSTMPMRKSPRNDDDDNDYDDEEEEIESILSDDEEPENGNEDPYDINPNMLAVRPPTPLSRGNSADTSWPRVNTMGATPQLNPMFNNQSFSPAIRRASFSMNTNPTEIPTYSPATRIKVRRKLPDLGPPQILSIPSYQTPVYTSADTYYQPPVQPPIISPYPSPVKPSAQVFPLQRISSNPLTNGESSYHPPINRHPIENLT